MSTNQTPLQRPNRLRLSHEEELSLRYGDLPSRPAFAGDEERRAGWFHQRDRLLQHCSGGQRPAGWWDFESPVPYPRDRDYAAATLWENGLLTSTEVTELTAKWREDFERAQQPGFTYCVGFAKPGDTVATWLEGAAARRAHYRWAGIPRSLLKEWRTQRRRLGRTVRELEEATTSPEPAPAA
jgi:hypothetical protein